jgi:hypothetical protein
MTCWMRSVSKSKSPEVGRGAAAAIGWDALVGSPERVASS